jgi:predicted MFS family arabinose efflux permease
LGAPFLAALTGNISRGRLLLGALFVFSVANLLSALSPSFEMLLLTRVLAGCCAALYSPTAYAVAATLAPPNRRGQALSIVIGGLTASTVLGVPLGTWIGQHWGWRMTFGFVTALAGLGVVILLLVGLPQIATPPRINLRTRLAPVAQPRILTALLPTFLWSIASFTVYTFVSPLLQQTAHVEDTGGLLLVYGLGGVVGNWLGGFSVDRFGPKRPLIVGLVALGITLATLNITLSLSIVILVALFMWGVAGWSVFPPQQNRLLNLAHENANTVLALNNSALYLGTAVGATIGGITLNAAGVGALGWVGSSFALLALAVLLASTAKASAPTPAKAEIKAKETTEVEIVEGLG